MLDSLGRAVVLHGVNMVNKLPPYHPGAIGFGSGDAAMLAAEGFNAVRLGVIWKGLEPEPGSYDDAYLAQIALSAEICAAHGLHVLIEFHQDMLNERFSGEGFPDWAVLDEGVPSTPDLGFPLNYLTQPALWRAYDRFWDNAAGPGGAGLQDRYAAAWRHAAECLRGVEGIFAYDIFNEPFPGSNAALAAVPVGYGPFDRRLTEFHRRVIAAIREVEHDRLLFYEPNVLFNTGARTHHGDPGDRNAGLSFHNYCPATTPGMPRIPGPAQDTICAKAEQRVFDNAEQHAREHGSALLLSEWGATDDARTIGRMAELCDRNMASWLWWAYFNRDPSADRPDEGLIADPAAAPVGDNLHEDKLDLLARPYPRAVAGTPVRWRFDLEANTFELTYSTEPPAGRGAAELAAPGGEVLTEISVPARHYPAGYRVECSGAEVASAEGAPVLLLRPAGGARDVDLKLHAV